jgi:NhaP-type Na+/H+ or K+/H+ antiporter
MMKLGKLVSRMGWVSLFVVLALLIPVRTAHAYLDPGSGSFIIQIALAALLGLALAVRAFWGQIVGLFKRSRGSAEDETAQTDTQQDDR